MAMNATPANDNVIGGGFFFLVPMHIWDVCNTFALRPRIAVNRILDLASHGFSRAAGVGSAREIIGSRIMFGKKKTSQNDSRNHQSTSIVMEGLEGRQLYSVSFANGILSVVGTD